MQNKDLSDANGTIEPYQDQLVPLDQKACQNDARTSDNKQTDINQDAEIEYLEGKKATLESGIGTLAGEVMALGTKVTNYSSLDPNDSKTNADIKKRHEVVDVRNADQRQKLHELLATYGGIANDRIPELQQKDAANQAIYDNLGVAGTPGTPGAPSSIEDYYDTLNGDVDDAKLKVLSASDDSANLEDKYDGAALRILEERVTPGDEGLSANVCALEDTVGIKTPGYSISDQTADIKA